MTEKRRVLAVVAHPDDEIIGLGGTLLKHKKEGDSVYVLILGDGKSSREEKYRLDSGIQKKSFSETDAALKILKINKYFRLSLSDNRFDSMDLLDLVKKVSKIVKEINPDIVYTHHSGDLNIDHQRTSEAVIISCRPIENKVGAIYMFETLSSTEMAGFKAATAFLPNMFVDISNELNTKLKAMSKYKSELRNFPHPRSLKTIGYNAKVWGSKINTKAAEAFYVFRSIR